MHPQGGLCRRLGSSVPLECIAVLGTLAGARASFRRIRAAKPLPLPAPAVRRSGGQSGGVLLQAHAGERDPGACRSGESSLSLACGLAYHVPCQCARRSGSQGAVPRALGPTSSLALSSCCSVACGGRPPKKRCHMAAQLPMRVRAGPALRCACRPCCARCPPRPLAPKIRPGHRRAPGPAARPAARHPLHAV